MKLNSFWSSYFLGRKSEREEYIGRVCAERASKRVAKEWKYAEQRLDELRLSKQERTALSEDLLNNRRSSEKRNYDTDECLVTAGEALAMIGSAAGVLINPLFTIPMYFFSLDVLSHYRHRKKDVLVYLPDSSGLIGRCRDAYADWRTHSRKQ